MATFTTPDPEPDWTDPEAVLTYRVEADRPYAGTNGFDEPRFCHLSTQEIARTTNMASSITNHFLLADDTPPDARLTQITAPTLILHGTTDPMFPLEHGEALAAEIPNAHLIPLPGVGHQQPPPHLWDQTLTALTNHTAQA